MRNTAPRSKIKNQKSKISAPGFTLVELLVVIGIIVLLIGILLPVVNGVRKQAYVASSANQILRITSASASVNVSFPTFVPTSAFGS